MLNITIGSVFISQRQLSINDRTLRPQRMQIKQKKSGESKTSKNRYAPEKFKYIPTDAGTLMQSKERPLKSISLSEYKKNS